MSQWEKQFPQLKEGLIYLDTAATALKPQRVIDTMVQFYSKEYATVHRGAYRLSQNASGMYEQARLSVARFIGSSLSENIVFTKNTTDSLNLVCFGYMRHQLEKGDRILVIRTEHHSNFVCWQQVAKEKGVHLDVVDVLDDGQIDFEDFKRKLSKKTKLVSTAFLSNVSGMIFPIEKIRDLCKEVGALLCVDAAQAVSSVSIDVEKLDIDFLAFSSHKLYGPTGVGVLYGKAHLLEKMQPLQFGGDMVDQVDLENTSFQKAPLKFEAGTPAIAQVIGLGAAIDWLTSIGIDHISSHLKEITSYAYDQLLQVSDVHIVGQRAPRGPLLSFWIDGVHPLDVATLLDQKGICLRSGHLCAQPAMARFGKSHLLRVSFGIYTSKKQIDQFITALQEVLATLHTYA